MTMMHMSCSDIQAILSSYLDDELAGDSSRGLSADTTSIIQVHLADCEGCLDVYMALRVAQAGVSDLAHTTPVAEPSGGLWKNLAAQLEQDKAEPLPCVYDEEYLSAYFDGELASGDAQYEAFEAHLTTCQGCNPMLAEMGVASEALKQHGFRLEALAEAHCDAVGMTGRVMDAFKVESGLEGQADCGQLSIELLSAFVDGEVSQKERMHVSQHVETCDVCKVHLAAFQEISHGIAGVAVQLERQAPEGIYWPTIAEALQEDAAKAPVSFFKKYLSGRKRWAVPGSIAAAVLFVLVSLDNTALFQSPQAELAVSQASAKAQDDSFVAWIPGLSGNQAAMDAEGAFLPAVMEESRNVSAPSPAAPSLASRSYSELPARTLSAVPSAEEYLFHVNDYELPGEDLPFVMGESPQ
jgi:anti-sigma factor RsiW